MVKDPITVAGAAALGAALTSPLGHVIGIPLVSLVAGFFGGLVALFMFPLDKPGKRPLRGVRLYAAIVGSVFVSVCAAGFFGPYAAALANLPSIDDSTELLAFSFVMGLGAQYGLLLAAVESLRKVINPSGGTQP